jgi:Ca2+-binding EF-hand superfamily protein
MNLLKFSSTLPILLLLVAGECAAQDEKKPQRPGQGPPDFNFLLERFDKNKDGLLDKDEAPERMAQMFERLDLNKDGKLSREEMEKAREALARFRPDAPANPMGTAGTGEPLFRIIDANGDGKLTKEEFQAAAEKLRRLDKNGDGAIDREELASAGRDQPMRPQPPSDRPMLDVNRIFERMDANKDGKLSKEEVRGPLAEGFDRADLNKDGFLDKEEVQKAAGRLRPPGDAPRPLDGVRPGPDRPNRNLSFDDLDKNADGRLTKEELKGTPLADKFDDLDKNKDGKLDPKEFEASRR